MLQTYSIGSNTHIGCQVNAIISTLVTLVKKNIQNSARYKFGHTAYIVTQKEKLSLKPFHLFYRSSKQIVTDMFGTSDPNGIRKPE